MEPSQPITPAPLPPPAPPAPAPAPAPAPPIMENGGMPPGSPPKGPGFFDGITLMDVGIVALVSLAMFYSIYASRKAIVYYQNIQNQTNKDIANLKAEMATLTMGSSS